ncbi:MAG: hypothetical protein WCG67_02320 [Ferruginibacter sp.]
MKPVLITLVTLLLFCNSIAQICTVSVPALQGTYSGECKKDKANGNGTATGIDTYTGEFKNGYPNGKGKYTWKNGDWYEGNWKNGKFEGSGKLTRYDSTKTDTVIIINGYWKKNVFIGKYEKPYTITAITNNISNVSIRKLNDTKNEITIIVKNITAGASDVEMVSMAKAKLTSVQNIMGRFDQQVNNEFFSNVSNSYTFRGVTFPYHAILSFETAGSGKNLHVEKIEVEILENSNWFIQVTIDN